MEKKKYKLRSWAKIDGDLIESDGFRELSGKEMWCLIRFHQKLRRKQRTKGSEVYEITNNSQIIFPYSEAIEYGVSRATFDRVIKKLFQLGFIDIIESGNPYTRTPTKYAVSSRWKKYGQPDFIEIQKERILNKGYGFQVGHRHNSKRE